MTSVLDLTSPESVAAFLRRFNGWRRGEDLPMPDPREIGAAIDAAIMSIERQAAQIATLDETIRAAHTAMTAAPAWHEQHRACIRALKQYETTAQPSALADEHHEEELHP